jgi:membrane protease YdiL (CAAX protease family)
LSWNCHRYCIANEKFKNPPVARITGRIRSPIEIIDVIFIAPVAEELLFRGVIWFILMRLLPHDMEKEKELLVLLLTSGLFGVEHIGYWFLSNGTIQINAILHAFSMVFAGACFGYFRQIARSLSVPIVIHVVANAIILFFQ